MSIHCHSPSRAARKLREAARLKAREEERLAEAQVWGALYREPPRPKAPKERRHQHDAHVADWRLEIQIEATIAEFTAEKFTAVMEAHRARGKKGSNQAIFETIVQRRFPRMREPRMRLMTGYAQWRLWVAFVERLDAAILERRELKGKPPIPKRFNKELINGNADDVSFGEQQCKTQSIIQRTSSII
jgi:hypothetical protein